MFQRASSSASDLVNWMTPALTSHRAQRHPLAAGPRSRRRYDRSTPSVRAHGPACCLHNQEHAFEVGVDHLVPAVFADVEGRSRTYHSCVVHDDVDIGKRMGSICDGGSVGDVQDDDVTAAALRVYRRRRLLEAVRAACAQRQVSAGQDLGKMRAQPGGGARHECAFCRSGRNERTCSCDPVG